MMLALDSLSVLSDGAVIGADIGDGKDRIIRTQSHDTGSTTARSVEAVCGNSGHYKVLWACVDRTRFVAPGSVAGSDFSFESAERPIEPHSPLRTRIAGSRRPGHRSRLRYRTRCHGV